MLFALLNAKAAEDNVSILYRMHQTRFLILLIAHRSGEEPALLAPRDVQAPTTSDALRLHGREPGLPSPFPTCLHLPRVPPPHRPLAVPRPSRVSLSLFITLWG